jgi:3-oxoacyl-[acyl-carrier protein] reductase
MDLGIAGRKAIVCAGSRGLGRACAVSLAQNGVRLVINGRTEEDLERTANEIREETGVAVETVAGDVSEPGVQERLIAACPDPDILVNNNGGPPRRDFRDIDRGAFLRGVVMNMATPVELIKSVIDGMSERRFGRIVNVTSVSVKMPILGLDLSSGARAGLTAFLAGIAPSVVDRNVTINNLLPGYFATGRLEQNFREGAKLMGITYEEFVEKQLEIVPARRFGDPAEFGDACAFLCSSQAGYVTGQNLLMDGGQFPGAW